MIQHDTAIADIKNNSNSKRKKMEHDVEKILQIQIDSLSRSLDGEIEKINVRIDGVNALSLERIASIKDNILLIMSEADKAITKAAIATDKRFDSVNEFRAQLDDQAKLFLNASEYRIAHSALVDKVDTLKSQVITMEGVAANRPPTVSNSTFFVGISSTVVVIVLAIIGGAIQIGTLQAHVTIDSAAIQRLIERDTVTNDKVSKNEIAASANASKEVLNNDRLKKIEAQIEEIFKSKR